MSQFKRKLSAFTAMLAFVSMSSMNAFAALPGDVLGQTGNMGITGNDTRLDVKLESGTKGDVGQVDWNQFSVPGGQTVNFGFSGLNQTIINRVLGGQSSNILGKLTSSCGSAGCSSYEQTSKVILINPAGVMFGAGSAVDLNSFTVSTFDFTGAKNLRNMSEAELKTYQEGTLNKFSPEASLNGKGQSFGSIHFDSNYTEAFDAAGINKADYFGKTQIGLNGTNFDVDKSLALVSDNIDYRDSLLKTGENYNYITASSQTSYSNAKIITADGVTFKYLKNGYADNDYVIDEDSKNNVVRNISIDNSGLAADAVAIKSGNISISNKSNAAGSNIRIANSIIKGTKLVNTERGDIVIAGSKDVNIDNSRLETINTSVTYNDVTTDTTNNAGGEIAITGDSITVGDSLLMTAGSNEGSYKVNQSGRVRMYGQSGNVSLDNTKVISAGDVTLDTAGKVDVDGSLIYANNEFTDSSVKRDINIYGMEGIDINNSVIDATRNINIAAETGRHQLSGDVNITSTLKNDKNQTFINAGNKLSIKGQNTTLDNASTYYNDIVFYGDGSTGVNNVTVKNATTFGHKGTSGRVDGHTDLETNGNFTMDGASMKIADYVLNFDRNGDDSLTDNGRVDGINYNIGTTTYSPVYVNVTSTTGDVTAQNNTNIVADESITFTANAGNVITKTGTKLTAGDDITFNAAAGKVSLNNSTITATSNDVTANAQNIEVKGSKVKAGNNIEFTADNNIDILTPGATDMIGALQTELAAGKAVNLTGGLTDGTVSIDYATIKAGQNYNNANVITDEDKLALGLNVTAANYSDQGAIIGAGGSIDIIATNDITSDSSMVTSYGGDVDMFAGNNVSITGRGELIQSGKGDINKGNIKITGNDVKILDGATISSGANADIVSTNSMKFGLDTAAGTTIGNTTTIDAANNLRFAATGSGSDITAEKTEMGTVEYGGRLTFDANRNNNITSANSLKGVKVDFVAGNSNNISAQNDLQLVDSNLKSANNNISTTVDGDVILNKVTIAKATADAKDTVTRINAKGNVTTADVLGTVANDTAAGTTHTAFYDVDWTGDATRPTGNTSTTALDVNQTKLVINTSVDAITPDNNTNGSVYLDLKNANNAQAGIEITAENTAWDGQIGVGQGPEVRVDAYDNELAISKIVTDKLTLSYGDKMIAADVELTDTQKAGLPEGTPSKGYIEVRDKGGFNMDRSTTYDNSNSGFNYNNGEHYDSLVDVDKDEVVTYGEEKHIGHKEEPQSDGTKKITDTYEKDKTTTTTTTTTTTDRKHTVDFDKQNEGDKFILVYEKTKVDVSKPVTVTEKIQREEVSYDTCPDLPDDIDDTDRSDVDADSMINQIRLPREQVEVSKTSKVSDNTVDQTANVMSAAARIDLGQNANSEDDDDDDSDNE